VRIGAVDREGKGAMKVKEKPQTVIGYPGNVAYREFNVVRSWVLTGALADAQGKPLANARFELNGAAYYTDETGFFTLEEALAPGETLSFTGAEFSCGAKIPPLDEGAALADLGTVTCESKTRAP
jgi:hypothetical protein